MYLIMKNLKNDEWKRLKVILKDEICTKLNKNKNHRGIISKCNSGSRPCQKSWNIVIYRNVFIYEFMIWSFLCIGL